MAELTTAVLTETVGSKLHCAAMCNTQEQNCNTFIYDAPQKKCQLGILKQSDLEQISDDAPEEIMVRTSLKKTWP